MPERPEIPETDRQTETGRDRDTERKIKRCRE